MITAVLWSRKNEKNHKEVGLTLDGHAGAGPEGHDLVCAGVSALAGALGSAVERMGRSGMLAEIPRVYLFKGCAFIAAEPKEEWMDAVLMAYWTIQNGIVELAEQYPENIELLQVLHVEREEEGKEASA